MAVRGVLDPDDLTHGESYDSPEAAARGDIPERFVTVLGVRIEGDTARVWMLTNDRAPYEPYGMRCERANGRWYSLGGGNTFDLDGPPPADVLERAARLGCPDP